MDAADFLTRTQEQWQHEHPGAVDKLPGAAMGAESVRIPMTKLRSRGRT